MPAWFEEVGEITALTEFRDFQRHVAHSCLPVQIPVAIAIGRALLGALVAVSTNLLFHFDLHEQRTHHPHRFAQKVGIEACSYLAEIGKNRLRWRRHTQTSAVE